MVYHLEISKIVVLVSRYIASWCDHCMGYIGMEEKRVLKRGKRVVCMWKGKHFVIGRGKFSVCRVLYSNSLGVMP